MASAYVKYQCGIGNFFSKTQDLVGTAGATADTLKIALTNAAPDVATHTVLSDITEITATHGYSAGGTSATNVGTASAGTLTVAGTNVVFTASGGSFGPFQYAVLYNSTVGSGPLIAYWDYGSSISLNDTETFTVAFGGGNIFTAA